jgi:zinc D-Ala-D-Ala carboxypeptidase
MTQLTPHFTLDELTASETAERNGWDNSPNDAELANLTRLADFLEQVKVVLNGKPIMVNSAFRSKKVNDAVGSRDTSQHRIGCAADIRVPGMTPDQVVKAVIASGIGYDQVIREFDRWTHISIPNSEDTSPRKQALIIDKAGTRPYA